MPLAALFAVITVAFAGVAVAAALAGRWPIAAAAIALAAWMLSLTWAAARRALTRKH